MKLNWKSPFTWVTITTLLWFCFYATVLVFRHLNYYTATFDLGNMDQVMWQTLHGRWFQMVDSGTGILISRFNYHSDVLLLAYVPFYLIVPHPLTLTIVQLAAVTSAVFPLYWFAEKLLDKRLAALSALSLLFFPSLVWNILFDVHAVTLVIPLFIWAAWALTERRWWFFSICTLLLPLAKEEVGLTVALFGLIIFWKIRPRWVGILTTLYGFGISVLMLLVIIPHIRHSADHFFLQQYVEYGTTTSGVLSGIFHHPVSVAQHVFGHKSILYAAHLFGPFSGLGILAAPYIFIAGPEYMVNALSTFDGMRMIFFQYTSVLTPIIVMSGVIGLARWLQWTRRWSWIRPVTTLTLILSLGLFFWHDAPFPFMKHDEIRSVFTPSPYRSDIAKIKKMVSPDDALSVTNTLGPQFTRRNQVWGFPYALDRTDAIITLFDDSDTSQAAAAQKQALTKLKTDPHWQVILSDGNLTYLRRIKK